ncbi:16S rRNA (cytosine(1402)-N(4))-methyltransferase RsmH [Canibacter sp. lx-45]|uniref:16S rRNA (cytosine(1402)-N(4))-methyltransferase RsmH n=1 Tax=Canibacter zhuwentaonis TaxID=2837491 RepID=UPI001BDD188D|nr:16S rRNA (cytosine(1402)-N(4))-methyltransferase RsmH [Canibacter zhuwentaonis]MBT1035251.1 16S rRNA (cytosine(1402)-N(4))-methyltransferase RsmH [Canibacter zhuwentaonis]
MNTSDTKTLHTPVMLQRCLELLTTEQAERGAIIVDATLGLGGHAQHILERFKRSTVIGLDRDPAALTRASERLASYKNRFFGVYAVYDELPEVLEQIREREGITLPFAGVLFDLGVSSMQLDFAARGFSYAQNAPLDMRMDQSRGKTAAQLLAQLSGGELATLFRRYSDEPLAMRYAAAIVSAREEGAITESAQLVEILQRATPMKLKQQRHPAKRVFQALRVAVNDELTVLERAIPSAMNSLAVGGRVVVMSYQSQEDRIVKKEFAQRVRDNTPPGLPQQLPEHAPEYRLLTRGAEQAGAQEQETNPRSKPVKLRAAEKVR